jgi:hypothetical protein
VGLVACCGYCYGCRGSSVVLDVVEEETLRFMGVNGLGRVLRCDGERKEKS